MICEHCGAELAEDQMHILVECFTHLHNRIEELESDNRSLREAVEAYKRQLKKIQKTTATVPPSVV